MDNIDDEVKVGDKMKFELNEYTAQLSDEEILQDLQMVAKKLSTDYLSISAYKKSGKYSQTAIQGHFGTWKNALMQAGLKNERNSKELKLISDEEYYSDFQRVAKLLGLNTVPYSEYKKYGKYSCEHIFSRFGKWNTVLEQSGLDSTGCSKDKITEQQCFDEIERMWILLGQQPTSTDIIKGNISLYSIDTFKRRFGGWRKALEAFVNYINQTSFYEDENSEEAKNIYQIDGVENNTPSKKAIDKSEDETPRSPLHTTSRNINTRLRFKVLQRDNFKCCACGASPAKDPSVVLHVDHIIPWSKGGETVEENLQTLCSKCNLGKSDII